MTQATFPPRFFAAAAAAALVAFAGGCTQAPGQLHAAVKPTIVVHNGGQLVLKHERVSLTADPGRRLAAADNTFAFAYAIDETGLVPPVTVGGHVTQAADVAISADGQTAAIAYNTAGDAFAGAVQIVDIHDPAAPKILRQIDFPHMDVNCVTLDGRTLYFGGAADPDTWAFKSSFGSIDLDHPTASAIMDGLRGCRSWAATGIVVAGDKVYVGVGAKGGGVEIFDRSHRGIGFVPMADVRSLATDAAGVVALAGTTDADAAHGQLLHLDGAAKAPQALADFGSPYAKATLEVAPDGLALLALSQGGLSIRRDGAEVFALANPTDDKKTATNGASADGSLVFTANGEYGFRVLEIMDRAGSQAGFAHLVGHHALPSTAGNPVASANFLRYKAGTLAVAAGASGLGLYHVAAN